jgi:hypothetical protein
MSTLLLVPPHPLQDPRRGRLWHTCDAAACPTMQLSSMLGSYHTFRWWLQVPHIRHTLPHAATFAKHLTWAPTGASIILVQQEETTTGVYGIVVHRSIVSMFLVPAVVASEAGDIAAADVLIDLALCSLAAYPTEATRQSLGDLAGQGGGRCPLPDSAFIGACNVKAHLDICNLWDACASYAAALVALVGRGLTRSWCFCDKRIQAACEGYQSAICWLSSPTNSPDEPVMIGVNPRHVQPRPTCSFGQLLPSAFQDHTDRLRPRDRISPRMVPGASLTSAGVMLAFRAALAFLHGASTVDIEQVLAWAAIRCHTVGLMRFTIATLLDLFRGPHSLLAADWLPRLVTFQLTVLPLAVPSAFGTMPLCLQLSATV